MPDTHVTFTSVRSDQGTIVLFDTEEGYLVAVDHRPASSIAAGIRAGEQPEGEVASWQIVGREEPFNV